MLPCPIESSGRPMNGRHDFDPKYGIRFGKGKKHCEKMLATTIFPPLEKTFSIAFRFSRSFKVEILWKSWLIDWYVGCVRV